MATRVVLVDDHPVVRRGGRASIERGGEALVVAEADNGKAALQVVRATLPDLVVMDVHLPDSSGVDTAIQILAEFPLMKVILLTADASMDCINRALEAGVHAYLLKASAEDELVRAIRVVMEGRLYLSPEVSTLLIQDHKKKLQTPTPSPQPALSARELEVLRLIADGLRTKDIALRLNLGVKTVETHRANLMSKLKCASSVDLAKYAIRAGIASL